MVAGGWRPFALHELLLVRAAEDGRAVQQARAVGHDVRSQHSAHGRWVHRYKAQAEAGGGPDYKNEKVREVQRAWM